MQQTLQERSFQMGVFSKEDLKKKPCRWACHLSVEIGDGKKHFGSGWLAARRIVVTAAHNVCDPIEEEDPDTGEKVHRGVKVANKVLVRPGFMRGENPAYAVTVPKAAIHIAPEYEKTGDRHHDYAVIVLPEDVKDIGHFVFGQGANLQNKMVKVQGYPGNGNRQFGFASRLLRVAEKTLKTKIQGRTRDSLAGVSGGPIWVLHDGKHCTIATVKGGDIFRRLFGIRFHDTKLAFVRRFVNQHK